VLEHHVRSAAYLVHLVDDDDVLVLAAGGGPRLDQEAPGARPAVLEEDLDRDQAAKLGVARQEHGAHAALPELADDLVVVDRAADAERRFLQRRLRGGRLEEWALGAVLSCLRPGTLRRTLFFAGHRSPPRAEGITSAAPASVQGQHVADGLR